MSDLKYKDRPGVTVNIPTALFRIVKVFRADFGLSKSSLIKKGARFIINHEESVEDGVCMWRTTSEPETKLDRDEHAPTPQWHARLKKSIYGKLKALKKDTGNSISELIRRGISLYLLEAGY